MKKLLLIAISIGLFGCNSKLETGVQKVKDIDDSGRAMYEVTYDGCQYIIYEGYYRGSITHKANCKNHK